MSPRVEFHFDFGSPNAYFCHKVIPQIEARTGAKFVYVPVLLGGVFKLTNNQAPMMQFKGIKNKNEYMRLEIARFIAKHKLSAFKMNPHFPVNTVQIMRGAVVADRGGFLARYADAVFHHMWEEPKKLDDADVIKAALDGSGLDGAAVLAGIQVQDVKDTLMANTEASVGAATLAVRRFLSARRCFLGKTD